MESAPHLSEARKAALLALLDDSSPVVQRALLEHLHSLGDEGCAFLCAVAGGPNRIAALHARWFLEELEFTDPVEEFRGFIRSLSYELETGAILLARTVDPSIDVLAVCAELDRIADRCRELQAGPQSARECCRIINRVLFHELGYRGNLEDYANPENSFIHRVLQRRTGLPITLSIIYLLVAERLGVRLEPVALPGHFVVGLYTESPVLFIDAFNRGRFLSTDEVVAYLLGRGIEPDLVHFAPATVRETLCRCCRNLAHHYAAAGQQDPARLFISFVHEFESAHLENAQ